MKEKTAVTYTELCSELLTSLYLSGQKELFALSIFKSLQILFKLGNSDNAASCYVAFGLTLSSIGMTEVGYRYGKLALSVADNSGNPKMRTIVVYVAKLLYCIGKRNLQKYLRF